MKLIEAGWQSYRLQVVPKDAGPVQRAETEQAFYSGATYLFDSIMTILDPGTEPTERDLQTMEALALELADWRKAKGFA